MSVELNFTRAEYDQRIAKTRRAMEKAGFDIIIVTDPPICIGSPAMTVGPSMFINALCFRWKMSRSGTVAVRMATARNALHGSATTILSAIPIIMCSRWNDTPWICWHQCWKKRAGLTKPSPSSSTITGIQLPRIMLCRNTCRMPASWMRKDWSTGSAPSKARRKSTICARPVASLKPCTGALSTKSSRACANAIWLLKSTMQARAALMISAAIIQPLCRCCLPDPTHQHRI